MSEDAEINRIMAKKLAEMRQHAEEKKPKSPRDILVSVLGYRGMEVLETAEKQFPQQMEVLIPRIASLVSSGHVRKIDGGQFMTILRLVGLGVRMQTSIKVEKDGKMVTLSEKLRSE